MGADASLHIVSFDRLARSFLRRCRRSNLPIVTVFQRSWYLDIAGPRSDKHTVKLRLFRFQKDVAIVRLSGQRFAGN